MIGIKRDKMGINKKGSLAQMKTGTMTFCDLAYTIMRCSGLMGVRLCYRKKKKKMKILADLSFPCSIEFKRQCVSRKTRKGIFICAYWIPFLPGWLCRHKAAYFDM